MAAVAYPDGQRNVDQYKTVLRLVASRLREDAVAKEVVRHRPYYEDIKVAMQAVLTVDGRNGDFDCLGRTEGPMEVGAIS